MELQEIIKKLKFICNQEALLVSPEVILEQSIKLYISDNINKSKKENIDYIKDISNSQKDKKSDYRASNKEFRDKDKQVTEKQVKLMILLKIPVSGGLTSKKASQLINQKIEENRLGGDKN